MSEAGLKIAVDAIAWIIAVGIFVNLGLFFANLKIYTEILKEKSQRARSGPEGKG